MSGRWEDIIEKCKEKTYRAFEQNHTYYFWKEEDIQSYLYSALLQTGKFFHPFGGRRVLLVHREYRTKLAYDTKHNYRILRDGRAGNRGEIDIVVLNPRNNWREYSSDYDILTGIEIKFQRSFTSGFSLTTKENFLRGFYPDYRKLSDPENNIKHKHIAYFVKRDSNKPLFEGINEIERLIEEQGRKISPKKVDLKKIKFSYLEIYNPPKYRSTEIIKNY